MKKKKKNRGNDSDNFKIIMVLGFRFEGFRFEGFRFSESVFDTWEGQRGEREEPKYLVG